MDLEKMKKQVSLLDYIQGSGAQVEKAGQNYRLNPCSVCGHKDHFTLYPDSNSYSSFSGCCKGGSIIDYFIEIEGLDQAQAMDKVKTLAEPLLRSINNILPVQPFISDRPHFC